MVFVLQVSCSLRLLHFWRSLRLLPIYTYTSLRRPYAYIFLCVIYVKTVRVGLESRAFIGLLFHVFLCKQDNVYTNTKSV